MDEFVIQRWRTSKAMIEKMLRKKKVLRRKSAKWPELEERLIAWVRERKAEGSTISTLALRLKAKSLAKEDDIGDFTASLSWAYRLMARPQVLVRRCTHILYNLPVDMADKMMLADMASSPSSSSFTESMNILSTGSGMPTRPPYLRNTERDHHHSVGGAQCEDQHH